MDNYFVFETLLKDGFYLQYIHCAKLFLLWLVKQLSKQKVYFALLKEVETVLRIYNKRICSKELWPFCRYIKALILFHARIKEHIAGRVMASENTNSIQDINSFNTEIQTNLIKPQNPTINFTSPVKVNQNFITLQQPQTTPNTQFVTLGGQSFQVTKCAPGVSDLGVGLAKNPASQPLVLTSLAGTVTVGESTAQQFIMTSGNQSQTQFISQNPQMLQLVSGNLLAGGNIQIQQQQNTHQISTAQPQIRGCAQPLRFAITPGVSSQNVNVLQSQIGPRAQLNQGGGISTGQGTINSSVGNPYNGMHPKGTVISVGNNQGQTILLNSVPAIARPILPKLTTSPEKQRLLVPLTIAGNVRPVTPRTTVAGNINQIKLQPQLFPKVNSSQLLVPGQTQRAVLNTGAGGVPTFVQIVKSPGQLLPYFTQVRPRMPPSSPVQGSFGDPEIPSSPSSDLAETKAPKKPCNCTKSQCLKLYCDCFANGEFCSDCNCQNCANNIEHESVRSKAIKACLDRNPHAFHPKIGKGRGVTERRHTKGCHCKRSGCLKNYCECYEAKILCSQLCKCTGCKNFEESPERKTLMHLADAAEVRVLQQNAAKTKLELQMENLQSRTVTTGNERLPFSFITGDVAKATSDCLISRAEELLHGGDVCEDAVEKAIIEEFGQCIARVISTSSRTKTGYMT